MKTNEMKSRINRNYLPMSTERRRIKRGKNEGLEKELMDRCIKIAEVGSIAEAALSLHDVSKEQYLFL